tara:strand:- start:34 stop:360 length:327 start_codon:yes stop_codon:yes gene_type:complete
MKNATKQGNQREIGVFFSFSIWFGSVLQDGLNVSINFDSSVFYFFFRTNQTNHCLKKNNATTVNDVNIDGYPDDTEGPCGYRIDNIFKLFVSNLRERSRESFFHFFLL